MTRFARVIGADGGRLSSIAMGFKVPTGVKKKMVRVAYAFLPSRELIRSRNGR